jgi:diguanylate cyclase (GGDEF)-like protein/PAS domain S-box-containing protein
MILKMKVLDSEGARRYWPVAAVIGIGLLSSVAVFNMVARAHPRTVPTDAWGALLVGFLMTALAGSYLYASVRRRVYDRAAAEKLRTSEVEALIYRDRILHAATLSAAELVSGSSLEAAMPRALQIVAEALQVDRILVLDRSRPVPGRDETSLAYSWQAADVPKLGDGMLAKYLADSQELAAWFAPLLEGKPVMTDAETAGGLVGRIMRQMKNRSTLLLPILVAGQYWGHIGVDDCKTRRRWASAELDGLGVLVGVMGTLLQREHAKIALQESEQRFRTIYDAVNEGIFLVDPATGQFVDANPRGCAMFGYPREEIIGRKISSLSSDVYPYTPEAASEALKRAQANGPQTFEWQAKDKGGRHFWVELSIRFTTFGSRDLVLATGRDIDERKHDEETIRWQADQYATMLSTTADGFWILDTNGRFVEVNDIYCRMTGYSRNELLALHVTDIDAVESPVAAADHLAKVVAAGFDRFETRQRRKDGGVFEAEVSISLWRSAAQFLCFGRDVTDRKKAERGLADSEIRLRAVLETNGDGIVVVDAETKMFQFANRAFCDMLGYGVDELPALGVSDIHPTEVHSRAREDFASFSQGKIKVSADFPVKRKDGSIFFADITGQTMTLAGRMYMVGCFHDVTERKLAEERIMRMARFDVLTGLANRGVFVEALEQTIARARQGESSFAVLYLDLDHFKDINDTLGHPIGDLLLQAVAQSLRAAVRETDTVARFGGDEFAVIELGSGDPATAVVLANKLLNAVSGPFSIGGKVVRSGASVGIAVFGPDSPDAETLLSRADVALYRAKREGRGTYRFFTDAMDAEVRNRVAVAAELRAAITAGQLYLVYQPQVDIGTGRIVALEALVRWHHPKRGLVSPGEFIPVAEHSGLIVALGHWVLGEACRQMKLWLDAGIAPALMSVNLSGLQFKTPLELENDIAAVLAETGLPPQMLELELTESVLMEVNRAHHDILLRLRDSGIKLAIDDFGNGYSSLDYLSRFPVDHIKIAQNFILDLPTNPRNAAIVRAAIHLAHELALHVVVEGVETAEELALIKSWGCWLIQGFYFSEPLPVAAMTTLLRVGIIVPDLSVVAAPAVAYHGL